MFQKKDERNKTGDEFSELEKRIIDEAAHEESDIYDEEYDSISRMSERMAKEVSDEVSRETLSAAIKESEKTTRPKKQVKKKAKKESSGFSFGLPKRRVEEQPEVTVKSKSVNREFALITYMFIALFVGLIAYFVHFELYVAEDFINNSHNARLSSFTESVVRGSILSADGQVLAETVTDSAGNETRSYPLKNLFAHVVGYSTMGTAGLEDSENYHLLSSHVNFVEKAVNDVTEEKVSGDNVVTTLEYPIQYAAYNSLGGESGAVVVIEVDTGKVLAMVSKPDYDPNNLAVNWESIVEDANSESVLYNRATLGKYPPGSTFKILTTLEYLREHPNDYEDYSYYCSGSISDDVNTLSCYSGEVHGTVDLKESFAESCNTSYANIGLALNLNKYKKTCEELLFNTTLPTNDFTATTSSFSLDSTSGTSVIMHTAIGQGETLVSPVHMAMIASAIDNGGVLMKPYLVDHIENANGDVVSTASSQKYGSLMTEAESEILKEYMAEVVQNGTGTRLKDQTYTAYGKTGTAEYSDAGDSHAWFVGFAHQEGKSDIAVAVVVEGAGLGSSYAVPIAKDVFNAYYN